MLAKNDELLTLKESAVFLRMSPLYAYKVWPSWGIQPVKHKRNGRLLFPKSGLIKMLEQPK